MTRVGVGRSGDAVAAGVRHAAVAGALVIVVKVEGLAGVHGLATARAGRAVCGRKECLAQPLVAVAVATRGGAPRRGHGYPRSYMTKARERLLKRAMSSIGLVRPG